MCFIFIYYFFRNVTVFSALRGTLKPSPDMHAGLPVKRPLFMS